jgi:hypothetical protein
MSKKAPPPQDARQAIIDGTAPRAVQPDFICITERHGRRHLRLAAITQMVHDSGQVGGPWFVRCDGQQLPVSEENFRLIAGLLGLSIGEVKS